MLLTADFHLTDNPNDEYRWSIFKEMRRYKGEEIIILGDLCDRKDRHSGELVNRLVDELNELRKRFFVYIIKGNHDAPLDGMPYWSFLHKIGIPFITKPHFENGRMFLPHTEHPLDDWSKLPWKDIKVAFMHQSLDGAYIGHGKKYEAKKGPATVPLTAYKGLKIYSGDIHHPQTLKFGSSERSFTYVGAPYPINFGDDYECRMLDIDDKTYAIKEEIILPHIQKLMLRISSAADLKRIKTGKGDQACIELTMPVNKADQWPVEQEAITAWAKQRGVKIASLDTVIQHDRSEPEAAVWQGEKPQTIIAAFGKAEGLDERLINIGQDLLKEEIGS